MRMLIVWVLPLLLLVSPVLQAENNRHSRNFIIPLPVNINQADARQLDLALDGIGARKAQAIIEYREQNGPFQSVDDLVRVKGIGPAILSRNRNRIAVD